MLTLDLILVLTLYLILEFTLDLILVLTLDLISRQGAYKMLGGQECGL